VDLNEQLFTDWMRKCFLKENARDIAHWIEIVAGLGREKQKNLLFYSLHILRECLMYRYGKAENVNLIGSELEFVKKFSAFIDHKKLNQVAKSIEQSIYFIERNVNAKLIFHTLSFDIERQLKSGNQA
jgi:DNA polymerase-3 subunit delta'